MKGAAKYLYRAIDSTGQTIDFLLTTKRDTAAAETLSARRHRRIGQSDTTGDDVDKNPAYPAAVDALKDEGAIPRRVASRQCKYLSNVIEQVIADKMLDSYQQDHVKNECGWPKAMAPLFGLAA